MLAVDLSTLMALAQRHDGMIELAPQVGDFVAAGEPLFVLHGGAMAVDDRAMRSRISKLLPSRCTDSTIACGLSSAPST